MRKFLNFSTILFSYVLITVLVISCGGSSGGSGGNGGGTGGSSVPQPEPKDTTCLLADRADKDSWMAILCYDGVVMAKIAKEATEPQNANLLIPSTDNAGGTPSRTWDLSKKDTQIQISYNKDYTLAVDEPADGASQLGTLADATDQTAEFPLQNLTIASLLTDSKDALRSVGITFMPTSGSAIKVAIAPKLAVKSQEDFISMANVSLPDLTSEDYKVPFALVNNLDLVANESDSTAKFNSSIIAEAAKAFDFDGGGYTITLRSEIDTTASSNRAAIITEIIKSVTFQNFTLDINKPISGTAYVSTLAAYTSSGGSTTLKVQNVNININSNITVHKYIDNIPGFAGGLAAAGCLDANNVVVKTADTAAIRSVVRDFTNYFDFDTAVTRAYSPTIGGLIANSTCSIEDLSINNNVVDVTLGVYAPDNNGLNNKVSIGGLTAHYNNQAPMIRDNIVKFKIYRDESLPADFAFEQVAGLVSSIKGIKEVTNNLVYVDFSNLVQVKNVGGLFVEVDNSAAANNIANNMLFIADGFNTGNVTEKFGAAITNVMGNGSVLNFSDNLVSSPVTDYDANTKLASFVHTANKDINFNNLILDNKTNTIMFRGGGQVATLQGKVGKTNGAPLFTLAEAKTDDLTALFSAGNTSWEAVSGGYPQLKAPTDVTGSVTKAEIEAAWNAINDDLQTKLAARAKQ